MTIRLIRWRERGCHKAEAQERKGKMRMQRRSNRNWIWTHGEHRCYKSALFRSMRVCIYIFIYGGSLYYIYFLSLFPSCCLSLPTLMVFNSTHIFVPFVIKKWRLRRQCRGASEEHTAAGWRMEDETPPPPLTNNSSSYPFPPFPHTHAHTQPAYLQPIINTPPLHPLPPSRVASSFPFLLHLSAHSVISTESACHCLRETRLLQTFNCS